MPNNILEKWEEKTLQDILDKGSSNLSANKLVDCDGEYPVYGASGLVKKVNFYQQDKEYLAIIKDGAGVGRVYHYEAKSSVLGTLQYLFPKENVNIRFAYYYLQSLNFEKYYQGAAIPHIYYKDYKNEKLILPPLSQQQRIVKILDEAFKNIDKAKKNVQQNLDNAKELFESKASKMLFNIANCKQTTIGDECSLMTGGTPDTKNEKNYKNGEIKWLVSGDIHQEKIFDCKGRITEYGLNNSNAKYLPLNSVLIALNGQGKTRGTVALLKTKATCNQSLVSIMPKTEKILSSEYLYQNLKARYIEIRKMTGDSGNDRRGLNMNLIRSIKINIPNSIEEQLAVAEKLEQLRNKTKNLEQIYTQKIKDLDELKQSILQKAFNGEL